MWWGEGGAHHTGKDVGVEWDNDYSYSLAEANDYQLLPQFSPKKRNQQTIGSENLAIVSSHGEIKGEKGRELLGQYLWIGEDSVS